MKKHVPLLFIFVFAYQSVFSQVTKISDLNHGYGLVSFNDIVLMLGSGDMASSDGSSVTAITTFQGSYWEHLVTDTKVFFTTVTASNEFILYETDGTAAGTSEIIMLNNIQSMTFANNKLFFIGATDENGLEPWIYQSGTASMIMDINPGIQGAVLSSLEAGADKVYFIANDGTNGTELWQSDGTFSGTTILLELVPGIESSGFKDVIFYHSEVYFLRRFRESPASQERVSLNKLTGGTFEEIYFIGEGPLYDAFFMFHLGNHFGFIFSDADASQEIFLSDGTEMGTKSVATMHIEMVLDKFFESNDIYYLLTYWPAADDQDNIFHTVSVNDLSPVAISTYLPRSCGGDATAIGDNLFYTGGDPDMPAADCISKLWQAEAGEQTAKVEDLFPQDPQEFEMVENLLAHQEKLFFVLEEGSQHSLWVYDPVSVVISGMINPQLSKISLYPNPAEDMLYLETTESNEQIKILDMKGQLIYEGNLSKGQNSISLENRNIRCGVYLVQIYKENRMEIVKLVKK